MEQHLAEAYRTGQRTIAVDLDDVLSETNVTVCEMHNEIYGSDMVLDDFQHYLYWQNRGWGGPEETFTKVRHLYASGLMERTPPMPRAVEHLHKLQEMGFRLVLVTARSESQRAGTEKWLARHYPGVFTEAHFTGAFTQTDPLPEGKPADSVPAGNGHAVRAAGNGGSVSGADPPVVPKPVVSRKKRSKADVAHSIPAILLVDDSIENALDCATASPPVPVLLFGAYPWNRHVSRQETPEDMLAHAERVARGIDSEAGEQEGQRLVRGGWTGESEGMELPCGVRRVRGWDEVVRVLGGVVAEAQSGVQA